MYSHVLVPVGFDEDRDVPGAATFAQRILNDGGRITFLHVMEPVPSMVEAQLPHNQLTSDHEQATARLSEIARAVPGAHVSLTDGSAGRAITDWAKNNGVDCIAIASHRPSITDIFLGSTAAWVVRHAHCAVHVVR